MPYLIPILLLLVVAGDPPDGRKGNELYREGKYAEAADAYRAGLTSLGEGASAARYGLLNNLGSALYRSENFAEAQRAFTQALTSAQTDADRARAAYNAGNAAFSAGQMQDALSYYRDALLADPGNADARYNYEFVRRKLEEQQQQNQQQGKKEQGNNPQQNQKNGNQDQQQNDSAQQNGDQQNPNQQQEDQGQEQQPNRNPQNGQDQKPSDQEPQQGDGTPPPDPNRLSREQAERILQALESSEEQQLRRVQKMKTPPRHVEKDW